MKKILIIFISLLSLSVLRAENIQSNMKNVTEVLVSEHGWKSDFIGPVGIAYKLDYADGESFVTLHNLIQEKLKIMIINRFL